MPSAVMGPSKEGYVWVINDAEDKMYVPEGTIMGIDQDWEEEEEQSESESILNGTINANLIGYISANQRFYSSLS